MPSTREVIFFIFWALFLISYSSCNLEISSFCIFSEVLFCNHYLDFLLLYVAVVIVLFSTSFLLLLISYF